MIGQVALGTNFEKAKNPNSGHHGSLDRSRLKDPTLDYRYFSERRGLRERADVIGQRSTKRQTSPRQALEQIANMEARES